MTFAQVLDHTDDPEGIITAVDIAPEMAGAVGKRIVVFHFTRSGSKKPVAARVYFEYGNGKVHESANSWQIDGKETGNRIFFVEELRRVLPQVDRLIVEVESDIGQSGRENLWHWLKSWLSKSDPW